MSESADIDRIGQGGTQSWLARRDLVMLAILVAAVALLLWNGSSFVRNVSFIGADLGATHATVALTDLRGTVVAETSQELDIRGGPEVVLDAVSAIGKGLLRSAHKTKRQLVGVGLGLPRVPR